MTFDRSKKILGIYGASASAWPVEDAEAVHKLLASSAPARSLRHAAEGLDAAILSVTGFGTVPEAAIGRTISGALTRIDTFHVDSICMEPVDSWHAWFNPAAIACAGLILFAVGVGIGASHQLESARHNSAATIILQGPYGLAML